MVPNSENSGAKPAASASTTLSFGRANAFALVFLLIILVLFQVAFRLTGAEAKVEPSLAGLGLLLLGFVGGIVAHEFFHAVGWITAGRLSWSDIKFGFKVEALTPYAHSKVPMPANAYRLGILLPGIVTGLLPGVVGIALGSYSLTALGAILLGSAGGDLLALWAMRFVPGSAVVRDHPSLVGCEVVDQTGETEVTR
jgi:hypothetical protein